MVSAVESEVHYLLIISKKYTKSILNREVNFLNEDIMSIRTITSVFEEINIKNQFSGFEVAISPTEAFQKTCPFARLYDSTNQEIKLVVFVPLKKLDDDAIVDFSEDLSWEFSISQLPDFSNLKSLIFDWTFQVSSILGQVLVTLIVKEIIDYFLKPRISHAFQAVRARFSQNGPFNTVLDTENVPGPSVPLTNQQQNVDQRPKRAVPRTSERSYTCSYHANA